jgi:hypothetical protein
MNPTLTRALACALLDPSDRSAFDALRRHLDRQGPAPQREATSCSDPAPCVSGDPLPPLEVFLIGPLALLWTWGVACAEPEPTAPVQVCERAWSLGCKAYGFRMAFRQAAAVTISITPPTFKPIVGL